MPLSLVEAAIALVSLIDEVCIYALKSSGALAHPVRRRVVSILVDYDVLRREELAELIATGGSISRNDSERLEIALHHAHLPKLDEELLIDYDQRTGDVVLWEDPDTVNEMLDSA
ncbi:MULTISPECIES: DUF7344 domain-containing protein [Natrialbaceae]|uniref:DUF7344 domain-containing protein n=1 Tax=Natrialbaceae TaxID=1644061 RepID=UPI00207CB354|nr:hypothetical protein [Natronococcus sp. CG52]